MTANIQILRHVSKAHRFHVASGPATESLLMTMLGAIPQGEAK
jgi:hypothetical protein